MLTFVLLDYKSAEATINCVSHYALKCKSSKEPISFVVVDNSDDIENFEKLSAAWPSVSCCEYDDSVLEEKVADGYRLFLWKNTCNAGYAKGNNDGAKIGAIFLNSDYFIFSNNDIVVLDEELSVENLIAEANISNVAIVGPSIVGKDSKPQNPYFEKSFFLRWGLENLCYPFARLLPKNGARVTSLKNLLKIQYFGLWGPSLLFLGASSKKSMALIRIHSCLPKN